ncbi:hypothetical protein [Dyadobacter sp. BHUBP1]|uniref:hypothetical protein n=1 Tax=Dyadobacter sp. BHUBP1 TaxID=3424178 RepID=UPI003D33CF14
MLFQYLYPAGHALEELNAHLFSFFTAIRDVPENARFAPSKYLTPDFCQMVENAPKLKKKMAAFFSSFKRISAGSKAEFYSLVEKSQQIENVFGDTNIIFSDTLSVSIEAIIGDKTLNALTNHLFSVTLKSYDIHDHYLRVYDSMQYKVCPFCGVEKMHKSFQEDYDHLAAKAKYPLVAVNMRNLAPMCHTCNSKNKSEKDVLHKADGSRRIFVYPYTTNIDVTIDFSKCILPQTDPGRPLGTWDLVLFPEIEIVDTWNKVFNIEKRYRDDYLVSAYEDWLDDFVDGLLLSDTVINTEQELIAHLTVWATLMEARKFHNLNFIKAPLFRHLAGCGNNVFYSGMLRRYSQKQVA